MMNNEKIRALLGLAQKAGKIVSGDNTCKAKFNRLHLIILATDSSKDTEEYYQYQCVRFGKPILVMGNKVDLGIAIGKSPRTIVGVTDFNFARQIMDLATGEERE